MEERIAREAKKDPKSFWSYIKSKTANRSSVGPIMQGDQVLTKNIDQAEALNSFFATVFSKEGNDFFTCSSLLRAHQANYGQGTIWDTREYDSYR